MTFDIPNKDGLWVFTSPSTWRTWVKPTQYNNFIIYVCGGGAGGTGANSGSGSSLVGGGGGGGGCLITLNTPSYLLPETLYINIGAGGAGGASATGSNGGATYLNYFPNTNTANTIIVANGGVAATFLNAVAGGAGGAFSVNQSIFSIGGNNGSSGTVAGLGTGIGSAGGNFSITTSCIYGGTGGAGLGSSLQTYSGGDILASNIHPQLNGGASGGGNGNSGYVIKKPFTALGGTGGGSNASVGGAGGAGGNGIMGSGGGGAGAGRISGVRGGRGGDGFIIIIGY
jgi:hypothetical protein